MLISNSDNIVHEVALKIYDEGNNLTLFLKGGGIWFRSHMHSRCSEDFETIICDDLIQEDEMTSMSVLDLDLDVPSTVKLLMDNIARDHTKIQQIQEDDGLRACPRRHWH